MQAAAAASLEANGGHGFLAAGPAAQLGLVGGVGHLRFVGVQAGGKFQATVKHKPTHVESQIHVRSAGCLFSYHAVSAHTAGWAEPTASWLRGQQIHPAAT